MHFIIAYGLMGIGKTTLLKRLPYHYLDYDSPFGARIIQNRLNALKDVMKQNGTYILDVPIFRPNTFIDYLLSYSPNSKVTVYVFPDDRDRAVLQDKLRGRTKLCTKQIQFMKLHAVVPRANLRIIEVKEHDRL